MRRMRNRRRCNERSLMKEADVVWAGERLVWTAPGVMKKRVLQKVILVSVR